MPVHTERLAKRWPEFFPDEEIVATHLRIAHGGLSDRSATVGAAVLEGSSAVFRAAAAALADEPAHLNDRVYRHVAFHLDREGRDPLEHDEQYREEVGSALDDFRVQVARRCREGWDVRIVVSTGNAARLPSIRRMVDALDGPDLEIFAYPMSLPLTMGPLMIANRRVIMSRDHRRWERPTSALMLSSASVAAWVDDYVRDLAADAPFRLRSPAGIDERAVAAFFAAVSAPAV